MNDDRTMTDDEAIEKLRENAQQRGGVDALDQFLIHMVRLLGVETTDRYIGQVQP